MQKPSVFRECKEVADFLMDFLDKKLPTVEAMFFRLHLLTCPKCRNYMSRYNTSVEIAKNIMDDPPPQELINLTTEFLSKRAKGKD